MISKDGISTTEENIVKIKNFPKPRSVKDVRKYSLLQSNQYHLCGLMKQMMLLKH